MSSTWRFVCTQKSTEQVGFPFCSAVQFMLGWPLMEAAAWHPFKL